MSENGAFHIGFQKNRVIHIFFVEKRGPIIYLAALKKGAIRHAHPYYAIYRKLPPPLPPRVAITHKLMYDQITRMFALRSAVRSAIALFARTLATLVLSKDNGLSNIKLNDRKKYICHFQNCQIYSTADKESVESK